VEKIDLRKQGDEGTVSVGCLGEST
jgi:hypothetical protein